MSKSIVTADEWERRRREERVSCLHCGRAIEQDIDGGWVDVASINHFCLVTGVAHQPPVTETGKVLTDKEIAQLSEEAERGYDVSGFSLSLDDRVRALGFTPNDGQLPDDWNDTVARTVCFDFDGVLHPYTKGWQGSTPDDEEPIPGALDYVRQLHEEGLRVVVVSSRCDHEAGLSGVVAWLNHHGFGNYVDRVTHEKLPAIAYIDDRAVHFSGDWGFVSAGVDRLLKGRPHGAAAPSVSPRLTDDRLRELVEESIGTGNEFIPRGGPLRQVGLDAYDVADALEELLVRRGAKTFNQTEDEAIARDEEASKLPEPTNTNGGTMQSDEQGTTAEGPDEDKVDTEARNETKTEDPRPTSEPGSGLDHASGGAEARDTGLDYASGGQPTGEPTQAPEREALDPEGEQG